MNRPLPKPLGSVEDDDERNAAFRRLARQLAPLIHERWRPSAKGSPNDVDFGELPEETREANIVAAERIPRILELVGLRVVPQSASETCDEIAIRRAIEANLEQLSEAEHEGWMDQKLRSGWTRGPTRDDSAKRHPSIVPYHELTSEEKDKDRDSVLRYPDLLRACGFTIVPTAPTST